MFNKLRQKFEKFVSSHEPAIVIMISVVVIVWSVALLIVIFSMLFGFWDIIGSDAFYIVITPFLPFVLIAFLTLVRVVFTAIAKTIVKFLEKLEERATRYAEKRQAENRESHFTKVAKKIDDDTLDLILKRSQIFSISIYLQLAACIMVGLIALREHYNGNTNVNLVKFIVPFATYAVGLILFGVYQYFDKVNTVKSQLKKLDDQDTTEE